MFVGGGGLPRITWTPNGSASLPATSCTGFTTAPTYISVTLAPAAGAVSSVSVTLLPLTDTAAGFVVVFVVVVPTVAVTVKIYTSGTGVEAGSSGSS